MAMITRLTLTPGQKGTKKLLSKYGEQLVCVRYRYDPIKRKRFKTVELIIDSTEWTPKWDLQFNDEDIVPIKVDRRDIKLHNQLKKSRGTWIPMQSIWKIKYKVIKKLHLEHKIIGNRSI